MSIGVDTTLKDLRFLSFHFHMHNQFEKYVYIHTCNLNRDLHAVEKRKTPPNISLCLAKDVGKTKQSNNTRTEGGAKSLWCREHTSGICFLSQNVRALITWNFVSF